MHDLEPSSEETIMNASMEKNERTKTADSYKKNHFNKLSYLAWKVSGV